MPTVGKSFHFVSKSWKIYSQNRINGPVVRNDNESLTHTQEHWFHGVNSETGIASYDKAHERQHDY